MALYRCAACGSKNVMVDTAQDGIKYNIGKGIAGTIALGTGGAAAGLESKTTQVYKCPDCGVTLTYPMPTEEKVVIDLGVDNYKARQHLKLYGVDITWDYLKNKYKNIESGLGDEMEQKNAEFEEQRAQSHKDFVRSIADSLFEGIGDVEQEILQIESSENSAALAEWEEKKKRVENNKAEEAKQLTAQYEEAYKKELAAIQYDQKKAEDDLQARNAQLKAENEKLTVELNALGALKLGQKKAIKQKIADNEAQIKSLTTEAEQIKKEISERMGVLENGSMTFASDLEEQLNEKYRTPENPNKKAVSLKKLRSYKVKTESAIQDKNNRLVPTQREDLLLSYYLLVLLYIWKEFKGGSSDDPSVMTTERLSEILSSETAKEAGISKDIPTFRVSAVMSNMVKQGLVERYEKNRVAYFRWVD